MLSMTGFGKGGVQLPDGGGFFVEINSVNRKQLEIRLSLPPELLEFETQIRKWIGGVVTRGAVQVRVSSVLPASFSAGAGVNVGRLDALVKEALACRERHQLPRTVDVEALFSLPGVLEAPRLDSADPELSAMLEQAVRAALENYQAMRTAEGAALKRDFEARLAELERLLAAIEPQVVQIPEMTKRRLLEKLSAENLPVAADDDRLLKEVLFYADKSDVTEEITRLHSHFAQFRGFLENPGPVGRSLDFLMQELFREITTLGNKAGIPGVSPLVVAFKSELEKLREQVQNVE